MFYIIHVVILCEIKRFDKTRPKGVAICITHCACNCGAKIEINGIFYLLCWIILPILTIYQYLDCLSYTTS